MKGTILDLDRSDAMHQTSKTILEIFCWVMECNSVEGGSLPERLAIPSRQLHFNLRFRCSARPIISRPGSGLDCEFLTILNSQLDFLPVLKARSKT
jgi:hypothetical protein